MSDLVSNCQTAAFACPIGMDQEKFIELITLYNRRSTVIDNGVSEIYRTFHLLKQFKRQWTFAVANLPLFVSNIQENGVQLRITALSPVHQEIFNFLSYIISSNPSVNSQIGRIAAPDNNMLSSATWIEVGDIGILLGADLEEDGSLNRGWSAVLASTTRPRGLASVFKVPHHGSANGHHEEVWKKMLTSDVVAVVTPWNKNKGLPTAADCTRINNLASRSLITAGQASRNLRLSQVVSKTIREANIKLSRAELPTGSVRLRAPHFGASPLWSIECSPEARPLSEFT